MTRRYRGRDATTELGGSCDVWEVGDASSVARVVPKRESSDDAAVSKVKKNARAERLTGGKGWLGNGTGALGVVREALTGGE